MLLQHLLLGFELGVYAPHEHCMLFWYALFVYFRTAKSWVSCSAWGRLLLWCAGQSMLCSQYTPRAIDMFLNRLILAHR